MPNNSGAIYIPYTNNNTDQSLPCVDCGQETLSCDLDDFASNYAGQEDDVLA